MKHIFLFPFAGGSSLAYAGWKFQSLERHTIEYSGHGFRIDEPLPEDMQDIVNDAMVQIQNAVMEDVDEYILFGHSMGALVAWLVAHRLRPMALWLSACEPPDALDTDSFAALTDEDTLMRYIWEYQRLPEKRMRSKIFMDKLMPVIRNDFRVLSEYRYDRTKYRDIPIRIVCSQDDSRMRYDKMAGWSGYGSDVRFYELSGDHFYIEDADLRDKIIGWLEA